LKHQKMLLFESCVHWWCIVPGQFTHMDRNAKFSKTSLQ
jgi:hypothetical protein